MADMKMHYYKFLKDLYLNMFEWENVPSSIDVEYLEQTLFKSGSVAILKFNEELIATQCTGSGTLNIYNYPTSYHCYSANGFVTTDRTIKEVCVCYSDIDKMTFNSVAMEYAEKLTQIDNIMKVNLNAQKTPVHMSCTEKQLKTVQGIYKQFTGNEPLIITDKDSSELANIKVFNTQAPFLGGMMSDQKNREINEYLTLLGIDNIAIDKKERLLSGEAESNDEMLKIIFNSHLRMREKFCKQVNEMFKTEMIVKKREVEEVEQVQSNPKGDNGAT